MSHKLSSASYGLLHCLATDGVSFTSSLAAYTLNLFLLYRTALHRGASCVIVTVVYDVPVVHAARTRVCLIMGILFNLFIYLIMGLVSEELWGSYLNEREGKLGRPDSDRSTFNVT